MERRMWDMMRTAVLCQKNKCDLMECYGECPFRCKGIDCQKYMLMYEFKRILGMNGELKDE